MSVGIFASSFPLASAASYSDEVLADSPSVYWRMEESSGNVTDTSGNGYTLTMVNTPTYSVTGAVGNAIQFDAASSEYGTSTYNPGELTACTYECWVKTTATDGYAMASRGNFSGFLLGWGNVVPFGADPYPAFIYDASAVAIGVRASTATINDGNWHHLVGTYSRATGSVVPGDFALYIDGSAVATTNISYSSKTAPINPEALWVNNRFAAGTIASCSLDELAAYETALSSTRVAAHYAAA